MSPSVAPYGLRVWLRDAGDAVAKKTEYVVAPDGLVARVVGPWVARKTFYVDRLAAIFATGMSKKWDHRGYVELFAGPGLSRVRRTSRYVAGSAMRALDQRFTHFAYVDLDARATTALRERIRRAGKEAVAPVFRLDCNHAVDEIHSAIPADALTLAFVDPTSWQVRFSTVAKLVENRHVDLLVTFHAPSMLRVGHLPAKPLDAFFDSGDWRKAMALPRGRRGDFLLGLYNDKLSQLGYLPSTIYRVTVKNTRDLPIYELVVFSRSDRGVDLWRKAIKGPDELGRRGFWEIDELGG